MAVLVKRKRLPFFTKVNTVLLLLQLEEALSQLVEYKLLNQICASHSIINNLVKINY